MKKIAAVALAVLLSACGGGLDGTYTDEMGASSYTFKSGTVTLSVGGMGGVEMDYKVDDGKVKLMSPQGTLVMNIIDDNTIEGPMGMKLIKEKK